MMRLHRGGFGSSGDRSWRSAAAAVVMLSVLAAGCSSTSDAGAAVGAPLVLPTEGSQTDGQVAYGWHQDYTSPDETPSRYSITVTEGWQPKQVPADSIAKYVADDADDIRAIAPITLITICSCSGTLLAKGIYIRNDGAPDITWRAARSTCSWSATCRGG